MFQASPVQLLLARISYAFTMVVAELHAYMTVYIYKEASCICR